MQLQQSEADVESQASENARLRSVAFLRSADVESSAAALSAAQNREEELDDAAYALKTALEEEREMREEERWAAQVKLNPGPLLERLLQLGLPPTATAKYILLLRIILHTPYYYYYYHYSI